MCLLLPLVFLWGIRKLNPDPPQQVYSVHLYLYALYSVCDVFISCIRHRTLLRLTPVILLVRWIIGVNSHQLPPS